MHYRRTKIPGISYFFTVNLAQRNSSLLTDEINNLRFAFNKTKKSHPFKIDAIVIMPEHLHVLMTLPSGDAEYSKRLGLIKSRFSWCLEPREQISSSRLRKRERGIWQKRFWEHAIRDENDYEKHVNYIHYNPVKHGHVKSPMDWRFSSIHQYIANGLLPANWACGVDFDSFEPRGFGE